MQNCFFISCARQQQHGHLCDSHMYTSVLIWTLSCAQMCVTVLRICLCGKVLEFCVVLSAHLSSENKSSSTVKLFSCRAGENWSHRF